MSIAKNVKNAFITQIYGIFIVCAICLYFIVTLAKNERSIDLDSSICRDDRMKCELKLPTSRDIRYTTFHIYPASNHINYCPKFIDIKALSCIPIDPYEVDVDNTPFSSSNSFLTGVTGESYCTSGLCIRGNSRYELRPSFNGMVSIAFHGKSLLFVFVRDYDFDTSEIFVPQIEERGRGHSE